MEHTLATLRSELENREATISELHREIAQLRQTVQLQDSVIAEAVALLTGSAEETLTDDR